MQIFIYIGSECKLNSWPDSSVGASERNPVVVGSNPIQANFLQLLQSFSGECHTYQFILLHSCDYLKKTSIKTNVTIDEGNGRNETRALNKEMNLE